MKKKRSQPEAKIPQMTRVTSKGIHIVKIQNHLRTITLAKSEIVRSGGYKCRTLEMNLQLREQLKTISYTCRLLYQNFRITANQKSTFDTQTNKKNQLNYDMKDSHQPEEERTREEGKKKEQQEQIQNS